MGDGIDSNREWMAVDDECSCEGKGRSQLHVKTAVPPTDRLSRCSRPAFPRPCPTDHLRTSDPFPTPSVPPAASPLSSPHHNTTQPTPSPVVGHRHRHLVLPHLVSAEDRPVRAQRRLAFLTYSHTRTHARRQPVCLRHLHSRAQRRAGDID